ncbi:helitron_like_N domain-containing protein [Nephila pilipes]|uniref:Helitron_like_N domain-containing protein n=1 Tax=Nephila pilipes TaxID=299642 RepID=A0A8X6R096_NEPPI|nr:helitron_like_N domain-containing protein [Nephila pilipes]
MPNEPHNFLQIYSMGCEDSGSALANRVDARCGYNNLDSFFARRIVSELDALLNEHNELLKIFKSHMHKLESDNHAIVINPDETPAGEHIRRFNAPVADDVAGIMVGDRTGAREIVIRRRNNNLQFIADTHRSYVALQYPLIFWKGQDGYSINIKQRDPVSVCIIMPQLHCNEILLNHVRLFRYVVSPGLLFQDDNALLLQIAKDYEILSREEFKRMECPAYFFDLNPTEQA